MRTRHFYVATCVNGRARGYARSRTGNAGTCDMLVAEVTQPQYILGSLRSRAPRDVVSPRCSEPRRTGASGEPAS